MTTRGFISLILLMISLCATAQGLTADEKKFSNDVTLERFAVSNAGLYTIDNGLTSSYVTCLERDNEGRIWLGTNDGLNSFDGYSFRSFLSSPNDSSSIVGKRVSSIRNIDDNTILVTLLDGGLVAYDKRVDKFSYVTVEDSYDNAQEFESAYGICSVGRYTYVVYESNIVKIDKETGEQSKIVMASRKKHTGSKIDRMVLEVLPGGRYVAMVMSKTTLALFDTQTDKVRTHRFNGVYMYDICAKDETHFYVCTTRGLQEYDIETSRLEPSEILQNTLVQSMTKSTRGGYWIAYDNNHLMQWNPKTKIVTDIENINNFLNKQTSVNDILEDENQILWLATSNSGLVKLDMKRPKIYNLNVEGTQMPLNYITNDIFATADNHILAACGIDGILKVDVSKKTGERIAVPHRNVYSIYVRRNGEMIVGTTLGPLRYHPEDGSFEEIVVSDSIITAVGRCIINGICEDCLGNLWFATQIGVYKYNGIRTVRYDSGSNGLENVNAIYEDADGRIWSGTKSASFVLDAGDSLFVQTRAGEINLGDNNATYCFADYDNSVLIGTADGVLVYNKGTREVKPAEFNYNFGNTMIYSVMTDNNDVIWISTNRGIGYIDCNYRQTYVFNHHDGLTFQGNECPEFTKTGDTLFVGNAMCLNVIQTSNMNFNTTPPRPFVSSVIYGQSGREESVVMENDTMFSARYLLNASLKVRLASSDLTLPSRNEFMYRIDNGEWIRLVDNNEIFMAGAVPGTYRIDIRATNSDKTWSDSTRTVYVNIVPPLWFSNAAIIFYIIILLTLSWFLIDLRFRSMKKHMRQIENEARAKKTVEDQRNRLAKLHKDQEDSIRYAKRIQESLMPPVSSLEQFFSKIFVFYSPKDIVSGDFYSIYHRDDKTFIIAADCTGHGVPGAFISILGVDHLYNIIMRQKIDDAGTILTYLHRDLHSTVFKRDNGGDEFNEGMDLTVCVVYHNEKKINFAGAMNDLYIIRDNDILTYHGDRHSIGTNSTIGEIDEKQYTSQMIDCQAGDMFYMFSDGYVDQFGGPEYKKFKHRRFKQLLLYIHKLPAKDQKNMLNRRFLEWKGTNEQTDDVSVVGFEPWE